MRMYAVGMEGLIPDCYYIAVGGQDSILTLKQVDKEEYDVFNEDKKYDGTLAAHGNDSIGVALVAIQVLKEIPVVTEVEVGRWRYVLDQSKSYKEIQSFQVIRHLPMEEVCKFLDDHREEYLKLAKENGDTGTIQAYDDYDYLKSLL